MCLGGRGRVIDALSVLFLLHCKYITGNEKMARGTGLRTLIIELNVTTTALVLMRNNFLTEIYPKKCM